MGNWDPYATTRCRGCGITVIPYDDDLGACCVNRDQPDPPAADLRRHPVLDEIRPEDFMDTAA